MTNTVTLEVSPVLAATLTKALEEGFPLLMGCSCCSNPNHCSEKDGRGHWVYRCKNCGAHC